MKSVMVAALAALVSTGAQAVPMAGHGHRHAGRHAALHLNKRDIVWVTEFEVETITVMKTVYGDGSEPTGRPDTLSAVETATVVTPTSYATSSTRSPPGKAPVPITSSIAPSSIAPAYTPPAYTSQAPPPAPVKSSSVAPSPAPEPTTKTSTYQAPPPAPITTTTAASTSAAAPAPAPAPTGGYPGGGSTAPGASYSGDLTYYDPGLGACGITSTSTDSIVAISHLMFDPHTPNGNPNNNPLCGRKVTLIGKDGSPYTATVVDRCVGCLESDLDLTNTLFNTVTSDGDGRVHNMNWSWA